MMNKNTGMMLMAAVMVARGTSFLFSKRLMSDMSPMNVLAVRFILAFVVLSVIFWKKMVKIDRRVVIAGAILGGAYTLCMMAEMYGLRLIDTGTSSFIENSAVVIVPIYEAVLTRKFPQKMTILCAFIAFAGVGFLTLAQGATLNVGIVLAIVAALIFGVCVMITKYFSVDNDPITLGILQLGYMGVYSLVFTCIVDTPRLPSSVNEWSMILMLALVCSCFGFTFQPLAQKYISVETAGLLTTVNPLTTVTMGIFLAGESAGIWKMLGGALIIAAIIIKLKTEEEEC